MCQELPPRCKPRLQGASPLPSALGLCSPPAVGTIFGIYRIAPGSNGTLDDAMRPGKEMVVSFWGGGAAAPAGAVRGCAVVPACPGVGVAQAGASGAGGGGNRPCRQAGFRAGL